MMSSSMSVERCFEDAEESGVLQINHKGLKLFPVCVDNYDLVDVLTVDISHNRFSELPQEITSFVMVERMLCKYNLIKTLPDLGHLSALTYLDVSQNLLQSLPVHLCSLPLKILIASHNKISILPSEIGLLNKLQSLDLSNNELTSLPSTLGDLFSLRSLSVRRNNIVSLPDELSKLKNLCKLDFSCNKISTIPPAFRLISSLIKLDLMNNPLSSPPAQISLKGRLHIVKYLSLAAQQQEKRWTMPMEGNLNRSLTPTSTNSSNAEIFIPVEQQHPNVEPNNEPVADHCRSNMAAIEVEEQSEPENVEYPQNTNNDSMNNTLTRTNQETCISPTKEKPRLPQKPSSFSLSNKERQEKILQEKGKLAPQPYQTSIGTPTDSTPRKFSENDHQESQITGTLDRSSLRSFGNQLKNTDSESFDQKAEEEKLCDIATRKEQLLKNKEEVQKSKYRLELIRSKSANRNEQVSSEKTGLLSPHSISRQTSNESGMSEPVFDGISKRNPLQPRPSKSLRDNGVINFTMRRFYDTAMEEFGELEKLREAIEARLRIKLPDDLPASLSDGIVLCHLVNHLRKGTIAVIHVPSSGVPKLTMPKCQMNVDAFLDACRRLGVEKVDLCTPPDILEEKSPAQLCRCVQALLLALGATPPQLVVPNPLSPR